MVLLLFFACLPFVLFEAARGNEIESLANAKAVLSGAGFS